MSEELSRIIHNTLLESQVPARVLAKEIGKPYSTLLREVNPHDSGAKLGVETFLQLLKLTGDVASLAYMAAELGLELVPRNVRE